MDNTIDASANSRFAEKEDIFSAPFKKINSGLTNINDSDGFVDHDELNKTRFEWFNELNLSNSYYASRYWEYPFAIIAAGLKNGMQCADVGCGTTPFTAYLCDLVGSENVTGIDNNLLLDDLEETHYSFGTRKSFVDRYGFNFIESEMGNINAPDASFDVVFCLSVLEHIDDTIEKQKGLLEMVRILKPGGKLILTFDTGLNIPLNDPLKIISFTGLIPYGNIDFKWPERRFVQYSDASMDVFGLVLYKDDSDIFLDQNEEKTIHRYKANTKYLKLATHFNVEYNDILKISDLRKRFGLLKVGLKQLFKRY